MPIRVKAPPGRYPGEVRSGHELGYAQNIQFAWTPCRKCGLNPRWIPKRVVVAGEDRQCKPCGGRNNPTKGQKEPKETPLPKPIDGITNEGFALAVMAEYHRTKAENEKLTQENKDLWNLIAELEGSNKVKDGIIEILKSGKQTQKSQQLSQQAQEFYGKDNQRTVE